MQLESVAFIGGGNMATAIINGLEQAYPTIAIHVCDAVEAVREKHQAAGRHVYESVTALCQASSSIVLAVKPQHFADISSELAAATDDHVLISILAGVNLTRMHQALGAEKRLIRCMPNTPMAIGQGMVGIAPSKTANEKDIEICRAIFSVAAKVLTVGEDRMDAITAVSGSGPAYFFHFCEVLHAAAMDLGFSDEEAQLLVSQTASGSIAYLCSQDGFPAARLREQVTSKGGTTAAALAVFGEADLAGICKRALHAAEQRGKELAEQS